MKEKSILKKMGSFKESAILLALILIMLVITIIAPKFMSGRNLYLVARQVSYVVIAGLGVFFIILTGGIDLSVGSVIALAGVVTGKCMELGVNPLLAILFGLIAGAFIGLINGYLVSYVGVAAFIVTLGMMSMARGAVWIITKGWPVSKIDPGFIAFGQGSFMGIPTSVIIMIIIAIISYIILNKTIFGRRVLAIGGNEEATRLSGVDVKKVKLQTYVIGALFASITGILLVARFSSAQSTAGEGWEMDAIAAAVIGGTSLAGGSGTVLGLIIGGAIMGVIRNGLVLMKVSVYWQTFVMGTIIIIAAIVDVMKNRRSN